MSASVLLTDKNVQPTSFKATNECNQSSEQKNNFCAECGHQLVKDIANFVCPQCGLVHERVLTFSAASRYPSERGICHYEINDPCDPKGLGSYVSYPRTKHFRDQRGLLSSEKQSDLTRQKTLNEKFSLGTSKRQRARVLKMFHTLVGTLELSKTTRQEVAQLLQGFTTKFKEIYWAEMVAGALYLVVRSSPRDHLRFKQLIEGCKACGFTVRPKKVVQAAGIIRQTLKESLKVHIPQPIDYFERILATLTQDPRVLQKLIDLALSPQVYFRAIRQVYPQLFSKLSPAKIKARDPYILAVAVFAGADLVVAWTSKHWKKHIIPQLLLAPVLDVFLSTLRKSYGEVVRPLVAKLLVDTHKPDSEFSRAVSTIRAFYEEHGRAPRTSDLKGIYSLLRRGRFTMQGLKTWADLLGKALPPTAMYRCKYRGTDGLQRALVDLRIFVDEHGRRPKARDLPRMYYAARKGWWHAQGLTTWSKFLDFALGTEIQVSTPAHLVFASPVQVQEPFIEVFPAPVPMVPAPCFGG